MLVLSAVGRRHPLPACTRTRARVRCDHRLAPVSGFAESWRDATTRSAESREALLPSHGETLQRVAPNPAKLCPLNPDFSNAWRSQRRVEARIGQLLGETTNGERHDLKPSLAGEGSKIQLKEEAKKRQRFHGATAPGKSLPPLVAGVNRGPGEHAPRDAKGHFAPGSATSGGTGEAAPGPATRNRTVAVLARDFS